MYTLQTRKTLQATLTFPWTAIQLLHLSSPLRTIRCMEIVCKLTNHKALSTAAAAV